MQQLSDLNEVNFAQPHLVRIKYNGTRLKIRKVSGELEFITPKSKKLFLVDFLLSDNYHLITELITPLKEQLLEQKEYYFTNCCNRVYSDANIKSDSIHLNVVRVASFQEAFDITKQPDVSGLIFTIGNLKKIYKISGGYKPTHPTTSFRELFKKVLEKLNSEETNRLMFYSLNENKELMQLKFCFKVFELMQKEDFKDLLPDDFKTNLSKERFLRLFLNDAQISTVTSTEKYSLFQAIMLIFIKGISLHLAFSKEEIDANDYWKKMEFYYYLLQNPIDIKISS